MVISEPAATVTKSEVALPPLQTMEGEVTSFMGLLPFDGVCTAKCWPWSFPPMTKDWKVACPATSWAAARANTAEVFILKAVGVLDVV
jgi:hypothetical protein